MLHLPALRWGQPYTSMDVDDVVHFQTGEPIARVSRANGGMIQRDMRQAQRARDVLRAIPIDDLIARVARAGELYATESDLSKIRITRCVCGTSSSSIASYWRMLSKR